MVFRFTIGRKIGTGFGILLILVAVVFLLTKKTINNSRTITSAIVQNQSPSVDALQELKITIVSSKMLINNWVNFQSGSDNLDKQKLIKLTGITYPAQKAKIIDLYNKWSEGDKNTMDQTFAMVDTLWGFHTVIKESLNSFESYEDPIIRFTANDMIEEGGDVDRQTNACLTNLDNLILNQRSITNDSSEQMIKSFDLLEWVAKYLGIALFLGGILIAFFTVKSIVTPVKQLRHLLLLLGKGIIPTEKMKPRSDEIGDMSQALNVLVDSFKSTTEFANELGSGNYNYQFQPLSDQDTLGFALLKMREDLNANEQMLQQKVAERTAEVVAQKDHIEKQAKEMEVLYKHVTDSIKYAKRIQEAILPPDAAVKKMLPNAFILYKPKDIVSGDFYWIHKANGKVAFAAMDCTGHGVPGAFMTIVGHNQLNRVVDHAEHLSPAIILDGLNEGVSITLHQKSGHGDVKDGMDAAMCVYNSDTMELEFAGAFNPLYLIRDGEIQQIKGDKFPVGAFLGEELQKFTNHTIQLKKGDTIYIFSDGYADQFGGTKGKKFMYKNFREFLLGIQDKSMDDQKQALDENIESWRGDLEQVDDILVIGMRV